MNSPIFYWECLGQTYPFDKNKKYLIYFKGGFCPAHRGHFGVVKMFTGLGNNISVMIHQIGSKRRHGVPYKLNKEIWRTYINELLPHNRVYLTRYDSFDDIYDLNIINNIDRIIYIRGNEGHDIKETENNNKYRFKYDVKRLANMGIGIDFYYLNRPNADSLSATKFISKLISTKRCKRRNCNCRYDKLKFFFPENLTKGTILRLVYKLQRYYLRM